MIILIIIIIKHTFQNNKSKKDISKYKHESNLSIKNSTTTTIIVIIIIIMIGHK